MSLQNKLADQKEQFESGASPEALKIMHRAIYDLRHSKIMDRVLKAGDAAPEFLLPNEEGRTVSSSDLLSRGPLVVGFYRGFW